MEPELLTGRKERCSWRCRLERDTSSAAASASSEISESIGGRERERRRAEREHSAGGSACSVSRAAPRTRRAGTQNAHGEETRHDERRGDTRRAPPVLCGAVRLLEPDSRATRAIAECDVNFPIAEKTLREGEGEGSRVDARDALKRAAEAVTGDD